MDTENIERLNAAHQQREGFLREIKASLDLLDSDDPVRIVLGSIVETQRIALDTEKALTKFVTDTAFDTEQRINDLESALSLQASGVGIH